MDKKMQSDKHELSRIVSGEYEALSYIDQNTTITDTVLEHKTEHLTIEEAKLLLQTANIPIIDDNVNYWFVRTNGGENFENFYFGNYIAIGWDKFNDLEQIQEMGHDILREQIEVTYPDDTKPGSTAAQILKFISGMKIGDFVLIPGTNCDRIAFGKITSDAYVYELTDQDKMDAIYDEYEASFLKRRNVEWMTPSPFARSEIDPMLIPIIYSYGTIVDANPYSAFINRTIYDLYYQNGELHSIFSIGKKQNISAFELCQFINNIFSAVDDFSEMTGIEIDKKELSIKASINSPGPVEIITIATSAFIVLSGISLFLNGAKVNFTYNIFNVASGELDINSPGLIDKVKNLLKTSTENKIKLEETQRKLENSKKNLEITDSKNKKKKKQNFYSLFVIFINLYTSKNEIIAKAISYTYTRLSIVYFLISNIAINIALCNRNKRQNRNIYMLILDI